MSEKAALGLVAMAVDIVSLLATGTAVWLAWPLIMSSAFPGLVQVGAVAGRIEWFPAVVLTWVVFLVVRLAVRKYKTDE